MHKMESSFKFRNCRFVKDFYNKNRERLEDFLFSSAKPAIERAIRNKYKIDKSAITIKPEDIKFLYVMFDSSEIEWALSSAYKKVDWAYSSLKEIGEYFVESGYCETNYIEDICEKGCSIKEFDKDILMGIFNEGEESLYYLLFNYCHCRYVTVFDINCKVTSMVKGVVDCYVEGTTYCDTAIYENGEYDIEFGVFMPYINDWK